VLPETLISAGAWVLVVAGLTLIVKLILGLIIVIGLVSRTCLRSCVTWLVGSSASVASYFDLKK
jgi:hypothetical protein